MDDSSPDELDWGEIWVEYAPRIQSYLRRKINDWATAEDITTEVFMKAMASARESGGPTTHFTGWLFRIAHNSMVDFYRQRERRPSYSLDEIRHLPDPLCDPERDFERMEMADTLARAMHQLDGLQAEVLTLRFLEDMSPDEVGERLGRSASSVKSLQHRGACRMHTLLTGTERHVHRRGGARQQNIELVRNGRTREEEVEIG